MTKYEREVKLKDEVEVIELKTCLAVKSKIASKQIEETFFVSKKDATKDPFALHKVKKQHCYLKKKFWDLAEKKGFCTGGVLDIFSECIIDPFKAIKLSDFDENEVVWFNCDSYLLYRLNAVNPISLPYRKDYIGGVTDEYFDLKKAKAILSKNPSVFDLTERNIPIYYEGDPGGTALEFMVKLPQAQHDLLCNYYRDEAKVKYWTCKVKDELVYKPYNKFDVLGLKESYIGSTKGY